MARRLRHPVGFLEGGDASNITIYGLDDIQFWPSDSIIYHNQPSAVTIVSDGYAVIKNSSETTRIESLGGGIKIPANIFESIVSNHGQITLFNEEGVQIGGLIFFRPPSESEPFSLNGYLNMNGSVSIGGAYVVTGYVDVRLADHLIISARSGSNAIPKLCAYNEDGSFNRVLFTAADTTANTLLKLNGDFAYVRACSMTSLADRKLIVYFP